MHFEAWQSTWLDMVWWYGIYFRCLKNNHFFSPCFFELFFIYVMHIHVICYVVYCIALKHASNWNNKSLCSCRTNSWKYFEWVGMWFIDSFIYFFSHLFNLFILASNSFRNVTNTAAGQQKTKPLKCFKSLIIIHYKTLIIW